MFRSATTQLGLTGTIANANSKDVNAIIGASVKMTRSVKRGTQSSLKNILIMSATNWSEPPQPTRFGP